MHVFVFVFLSVFPSLFFFSSFGVSCVVYNDWQPGCWCYFEGEAIWLYNFWLQNHKIEFCTLVDLGVLWVFKVLPWLLQCLWQYLFWFTKSYLSIEYQPVGFSGGVGGEVMISGSRDLHVTLCRHICVIPIWGFVEPLTKFLLCAYPAFSIYIIYMAGWFWGWNNEIATYTSVYYLA